MSIVKSKHASNYVVLPNEIVRNGLSLEAIGLLAYLLSLPHDWVIYKTQLHLTFEISKEKLDRIFKELQSNGYVLSVKEQTKSGKFEWSHIVYDIPFNGEKEVKNHTPENHSMDNHSVVNHTMDDHSMDKPPLQSIYIQSKEEQSKNNKISFTEFWDAYDKKVGDITKIKPKWDKLNLETQTKIMEYIEKYKKVTPDKQFRKNPTTFFNNKSWNDELIPNTKPITQFTPTNQIVFPR